MINGLVWDSDLNNSGFSARKNDGCKTSWDNELPDYDHPDEMFFGSLILILSINEPYSYGLN